MRAAEATFAPSTRLAGGGSLLAFGAVLISLLALVFPTGREYAELTEVTHPDAYALAYLQVVTRANPGESELHLVYARQLGMLGRYDEAIAVVTPLVDPVGRSRSERNLLLDLHLARARTLPENDPRRAQALAEVLRQLRELAELGESPARNEVLAGLALELGDPALAGKLYAALAQQRPDEQARFLGLAAKWLRAAGENEQAATLYQTSAGSARTPEEAAQHAAAAVQALEADDDVPRAADLAAAYADQFPRDAGIVLLATRLATACGRQKEARLFGRRALVLAPDDEDLLRSQVARELAAADPKAALVLLHKLVARTPEDYDLRVLRARTAEWASDLDTAERDLMWLVAHPGRRGA